MLAKQALFISALLPLIQGQESTPETVLGVYIYHRHGDRTTKSYPPVSLTDLGYAQVHASGNYYRNRYIDSNASSPIYKISSDIAKASQLNVQAPVDNVLQNSAAGFLQGLYPPVGATLGSQTLANGTSVEAPLGGFQLIPVNAVSTASSSANSESSTWLQGSSGCGNAITSSNNYFYSDEYTRLLNSTKSFYQGILPVVNTTFSSATNTFKNAYTIYDYVHVSTIHNSSIPSDDLLTNETLSQLQTLASDHEFNLAYNASEPIRAIAGSTLAGQILQSLNTTLTTHSTTPLTIQFGAYATFLSFFGVSGLSNLSEPFTQIVPYASSIVFELLTNATLTNTSSSYPPLSSISVRFSFANGPASENPPVAYPLFGQSELVIPYEKFVEEMNRFAVGDLGDWCNVCGESGGVCASSSSSSSSSSGSGNGNGNGDGEEKNNGISKTIAGVIGAMVTLGVVLGVEALVLLVAGLRVVRKGRLGGSGALGAGAIGEQGGK
ncbi:1700ed55-f897-4021-baa5-dd650d11d17f [Sclerotinia trifoliorum]|uniref:1700ed55-f897-4021-baa5-dd650d11d17f n=1 Tax=Sclerotinia trifoliorum TaxID=28548 RepID=A0A8H2W0M1_9HELO|nr:1700ed55-f897-4021-baa5-dd650d11d17f [Sclerotinia trifoliorum]